MPRTPPRVRHHLALTPAAARILSYHPDPAGYAADLLGLPPCPRTPGTRTPGAGLANPTAPRLPLLLPPEHAQDLPRAAGPVLSALLGGQDSGPIHVPCELLQRARNITKGPIEATIIKLLRREIERLERVQGVV